MNAIHHAHETGRLSEDELPEPPDNFDEFNSLPEEFRTRVANQFMRGIDHERDLLRVRVVEECKIARAKQAEKDRQRAAQGRGRRGGVR